MPRGDEDEIAARCDPLLFFSEFLVARAFLECFALTPFLVANCGSLHASRTHFDSAARDAAKQVIAGVQQNPKPFM
jgi:hypothetical protein